MRLEGMLNSKKISNNFLKETSVASPGRPKASRGRGSNKRHNFNKQYYEMSQLLSNPNSFLKRNQLKKSDMSDFYRNIPPMNAKTNGPLPLLQNIHNLEQDNLLSDELDSASLSSSDRPSIVQTFSDLSLSPYSSSQLSAGDDESSSKDLTLSSKSSLSIGHESNGYRNNFCKSAYTDDDFLSRCPVVKKQIHSVSKRINKMIQQHSKSEIHAEKAEVRISRPTAERLEPRTSFDRTEHPLNSIERLSNTFTSKINTKREDPSFKLDGPTNSYIIPPSKNNRSSSGRFTGIGMDLKQPCLRNTSKKPCDFTRTSHQRYESSESDSSSIPKGFSSYYRNQDMEELNIEELNIEEFLNHSDMEQNSRSYTWRHDSDASSSSISGIQELSHTRRKSNRSPTNRKALANPRGNLSFNKKIPDRISLNFDTDSRSTRNEVKEFLNRRVTNSETDDSKRLPPIHANRSELDRRFHAHAFERFRPPGRIPKLLPLRDTEKVKRPTKNIVLPKISSTQKGKEDKLFNMNMKKLTFDGVLKARLNVLHRHHKRMENLEDTFTF